LNNKKNIDNKKIANDIITKKKQCMVIDCLIIFDLSRFVINTTPISLVKISHHQITKKNKSNKKNFLKTFQTKTKLIKMNLANIKVISAKPVVIVTNEVTKQPDLTNQCSIM